MKIRYSILVLMTFISINSQSQNIFHKTYTGLISNNIEITAHLTGNYSNDYPPNKFEIHGMYFYNKFKKYISLKGYINDSTSQIILQEYYENNITGIIEAKFVNGSIVGYWYSADKSKKYPLVLNEYTKANIPYSRIEINHFNSSYLANIPYNSEQKIVIQYLDQIIYEDFKSNEVLCYSIKENNIKWKYKTKENPFSPSYNSINSFFVFKSQVFCVGRSKIEILEINSGKFITEINLGSEFYEDIIQSENCLIFLTRKGLIYFDLNNNKFKNNLNNISEIIYYSCEDNIIKLNNNSYLKPGVPILNGFGGDTWNGYGWTLKKFTEQFISFDYSDKYDGYVTVIDNNNRVYWNIKTDRDVYSKVFETQLLVSESGCLTLYEINTKEVRWKLSGISLVNKIIKTEKYFYVLTNEDFLIIDKVSGFINSCIKETETSKSGYKSKSFFYDLVENKDKIICFGFIEGKSYMYVLTK